ncbi:flagellar basal-body rod protein FlgF [Hoeflea poritis]|uniref:Flagellar basal-body rod protein FlgF n=1 Tax=Hoeflea poritis TaxID=2993659 RepID=A0ABT4VS58_9HYPH|nr:flagellar basal-body rod protein FlgF [Hoeflea poritis]MDA4847514.1 flagellar basal-body rod protein FlgF [Hoeflea poritis]
MQSSLYVALSSQIALENRLNTLADNIANASTIGYRPTEIRFESLLSDNTAFVSEGQTYLSTIGGGMTQTENLLDFAVQGEGWFAIETPAGLTLTRDGRFTMAEGGDLVTLNGYPVLDPGGAPIQLDGAAGPPEVSRDGLLRQNGAVVGSIGVYAADLEQGFIRFENSGIVPTANPEPIVDRANSGVLQGYLEDSGVNAMSEMSRLIMVTRAFENAASLIKEGENTLDEAVRTLGTT